MAEPPRARLFVALDLPAKARDELVAWQSRALAARERELRPVAPAALHVTLAFLGGRPEAEIDAIGAAMANAVTALPAPELHALAVKAVPRRRPRLFAIDLSDDEERAATVQKAVSDALAAGGFYTPEKRAFWPHITVARVRRGTRQLAPLSDPPPGEPFTARDVVLYRSWLSPRGARYEPLHRAELQRS